MFRLLSSMCTTQSKKGRLSPLTSSCMNLILLSTAFICSVKASTSLDLILTQESSTYLKNGAKGTSCEGDQGSALNFFYIEVGPAAVCRNPQCAGRRWLPDRGQPLMEEDKNSTSKY